MTEHIQIIPKHWMNFSIYETITSNKASELKLSNHLFKRLEACFKAEGRHFNIYCDDEF
jgi:hypothetical protein